MDLVLVADTFPPLKTSGAVQLRDLSREFVYQGHTLTVILPSPELSVGWCLEDVDGLKLLRLRAPRTKDIGYFRRTLNEFIMPFYMLINLKRSPMKNMRWDGLVWYSPSIFFGPLVKSLKKNSGCRSYLVLRDIFPEWSVDMGLMGRGLPYRFFKAVANYQYSVADVIGIQTQGNACYFKDWHKEGYRKLEVLQNWLASAPLERCSIDISKTTLAGKKVFVYAGNMGVAQGMDILLSLADRLRHRNDIGFLFVGRGRDSKKMAHEAEKNGLDNVVFYDEIEPNEIPGLYAQCDVGLVTLHPDHKTHNIPGKFLTYMQNGLPVLASINQGNDLAGLIKNEGVGAVSTDGTVESLQLIAEDLIDRCRDDMDISVRCRSLYHRLFSPKRAVKQIVNGLTR